MMRWSNVWLIFRREVRDQLRDRRTLFMIFLLPILLYPILGIVIAQFAMAFEQKPRTVILLGAEALPDDVPPLLNDAGDGFHPSLFEIPSDAERLEVIREGPDSLWAHPRARQALLRDRLADAVVLIPPDIAQRLDADQTVKPPIIYNSADERGQITYFRITEVLNRWNERIVHSRLQRDEKPETYAQAVEVEAIDIATREEAGASVWARVFPFLLVMMALTGAFYPAIDLCAGEKERGTMETLLISPAARSEIVLGKFLTVMLASIVTALLNLVSMGITGLYLAHQVSSRAAMVPNTEALGEQTAAVIITPPSMISAFWMLLLLVPLAAFFSAVCVALAVLARSMKEGQYYMTPLYLVALPLIFLSLAPGIELSLFYSMVPITGVSLLLKALMQGQYGVARQFFLPVLLPTVLYAALALKWAAEQFRREDVLFREAERFDLLGWLRHLIRDREPRPSSGQAILAFVLMLVSTYFVGLAVQAPLTSLLVGQVVCILGPPLIMTLLFTSSPRQTLRLAWPRLRYLALAVGLALTLHPVVVELGVLVQKLFPVPETVQVQLEQLLGLIPSLGMGLLLLAVVPAVCEEVAFRGFILSGFLRGYTRRDAVILSALLFGFLHVLLSLFQQLFNATLLGLVLGLLAVRSGSLLPGIVFHLINNGLALVMGHAGDSTGPARGAEWLFRDPALGLYHWSLVAVGGLIALVLFVWLMRDHEPAPATPPKTPQDLGPLSDLT